MGQSAYNLWKYLREFFGGLTAVGTGQDRKPPKKQFPSCYTQGTIFFSNIFWICWTPYIAASRSQHAECIKIMKVSVSSVVLLVGGISTLIFVLKHFLSVYLTIQENMTIKLWEHMFSGFQKQEYTLLSRQCSLYPPCLCLWKRVTITLWN